MMIIFSLFFISATAQLTFHSKLSYPYASSAAINEHSNGIILDLPHEGWVVSDSFSKTKASVFYATLVKYTGTASLGSAENKLPYCSTSSDDELKGSTGCFTRNHVSIYTSPRPNNALTSISEANSLEAGQTYKWDYEIGSNCLLPQITLIDETSVNVPTIFSNECQGQLLGLNSDNAAYFEVLGSGSAEWCIQTESQYNNLPGVCEPKLREMTAVTPGTQVSVDEEGLDMTFEVPIAIAGTLLGLAIYILIKRKMNKNKNETELTSGNKGKDHVSVTLDEEAQA